MSKNQPSKLLIYFLLALSSQSLAYTKVNPHKFLAISTHFRKPGTILSAVQITRNGASAHAHGFARGFIIAEGGGVAPVFLLSVQPKVCFVISASKTGATPFLGDY